MTTQVEINVTHVCQDTRQVEVFALDTNSARATPLGILTEPGKISAYVYDTQVIQIMETERGRELVVPGEARADDTIHEPLPVAGYQPQSLGAIEAVNANKHAEEVILRSLDELKANPDIDQRWLAIGRTHIEEGFMAINRAIFKPARVTLPEDATQ